MCCLRNQILDCLKIEDKNATKMLGRKGEQRKKSSWWWNVEGVIKKNQNVAKDGGIQRGKENIERKANKNIFGSHVGL